LIFIKDNSQSSKTPLDWTGFITLAIAIASFQYMLDRGERNDWFESEQIIILTVIGGLAFYIFISHSLTHDQPFLNPVLLRDRNYVLALVIVFVFGMLNFTPMVLLPPLLQNLRGYPDAIIGILLGARGVGTLFAFMLMVKANKIDPRYTLFIGFLMQGLAGWYMAQFSLNLTTFDVLWTSALQGFGVGLIWVPLTVVAFYSLDPKYAAEAASFFHLIRNFGSSLFISVSVAVVLRSAKVSYADISEQVSPNNVALNLQESIYTFWSIDSTGAMAAMSGEIGRQAAMIGYINAFYLFAWVAFAACPLVFLAKLRRGPDSDGS
jgi:DHA2 family multidrug resistance protein